MLPVTEAVTKRLSGTRSSTSWSLTQLLRFASLQRSCCLQDKTAQCLHDAGFGSVENLTNIPLCNRRLTSVRFSFCHGCNVLPEAENSSKLVVFLSEGFAIHTCKQPYLLSSDLGTMLHCVYTDQTASSHVHPQAMFMLIPKPCSCSSPSHIHPQAARDSLMCALVCTISFNIEATSCTRVSWILREASYG